MESANDCDDVRKKSGRFRYEFNWRTVRTVKPRRRRTKARSDSNDGNRTATSPIDSQSQSQELQRELSSLATFACGLDSSQGSRSSPDDFNDSYDASDSDMYFDGDQEQFIPDDNAISLTQEEKYEMALIKFKALQPLNTTMTKFVIQDFDPTRKDLKRDKFHFIERQMFKFGDNAIDFIYICSCDQHRVDLVKSLRRNLTDSSVEGFDESCPPCLHLIVAKSILSRLEINTAMNASHYEDDHSYLPVTQRVLDFPFICNAVCVLSEDGTHGIIGCDAKGFCCKTCRYDKHECIHVGALQKYILNDETEFSPTLTELIMMNEGMVETVRRDLRINLISRNKLPFKLSPSESAKFRVHITNKFAIGDDGDYILVGNSSGSCLSCGSSTDDPDADITVGQTCSLHTLKGIYSCKVYMKRCSVSGCTGFILYDGSQDFILNMGTFLVGHDLLRDYMYHFLIGKNRSERLFIEHKTTRELLNQFAKGVLPDIESRLTMDGLLQFRMPEVHRYIDYLENTYGSITNVPDSAMQFLKNISCASPITAYIPANNETLGLLDDVIAGQNITSSVEKMTSLQKNSPVLFQLLSDLDGGIAANELQNVLGQLQSKLLEFHDKYSDAVESETTIAPAENATDFSRMDFFPRWPPIRSRGKYEMDVGTLANASESCKKYPSGHPTLLPGIFTVYCSHGINYGFRCMESQESPNTPFTVFKTRFPTAPDVIIYDNCCSLDNYAKNRDPHFFMNTRFLIDKFHWPNHKACSDGYNISNYPHFALVNSQINEQENAALSGLKSQLSYMNESNFMTHCKFFLWNRNNLKVRSIRESTSER